VSSFLVRSLEEVANMAFKSRLRLSRKLRRAALRPLGSTPGE
jgi:hypothetical protein